MELETIVLSEVTQEWKAKHYVFSLKNVTLVHYIDDIMLTGSSEQEVANTLDLLLESHSVMQAGVRGHDLGSLQNLCLPGSKTGFYHVGLAGLELLTSGHPPTFDPQSARISGVNHTLQSPIWRQRAHSFALVTQDRVPCGTVWAHCNFCLLDSSDSPASAFQVAGITGMHH
ncbi:hypothetical protein AAY473_007850 [Plecturocebus cupreus]